MREDRLKINQEKHRLSQDRFQDGPGYGHDGAKMPPHWDKMPQDIATTPNLDVFWLLFLAVVCTSFAFLVTIDIVKKLGAFTVSLSINLEPVYTIILAIFILQEHEQLGSNFYIGSILIILVVIANGVIKNHQKKKTVRSLH